MVTTDKGDNIQVHQLYPDLDQINLLIGSLSPVRIYSHLGIPSTFLTSTI